MASSLMFSSPSPPPVRTRCNSSSFSIASIPCKFFITQSSSSSNQPSISEYNSLIRAQIDAGDHTRALLLFRRMLSVDNLSPNCFTFPAVLKACARLSAAADGEQIHSIFLKSHFAPSTDIFILTSLVHFYGRCGRLRDARQVFDQMPDRNMASWNAMLDGYARSGDLESAHRLFYEMPDRNIVSWNTLIGGFVRYDRAWDALKIFMDLQMSGINADDLTMLSVIAAVSCLGLLSLGRMAHAFVTRRMFSLDRALGVALIDMYAKCGSVGAAYAVFLAIESKNVHHWTSMIAGFAAHGFADSALQVFDDMLNSGILPNDITFIAVLNACSHGGLVHQGLKCFKLLNVFNIVPKVQHYGCIVDLLGRAGLLDEAMEIVRNMTVEPSAVIWSTLLAACRRYRRVDMAKIVAEKMIELDSSNGSSYALLSNLYGNLGRLEDLSIVRKTMEDRGVTKVAGFSWIEIDGNIHEFVSGDRLHFKTNEIYGVLEEMMSYLRLRADHLSSSCSSSCLNDVEGMV